MNRQSILIDALDKRVPALRTAQAEASKPVRGWLRAVRTACGLSQAWLAKKLKTTQQAVTAFETAEERGTITLKSLERAAQALDCELVYFVVPRGKVAATYRELARLHDPKFKLLQASEHSMALEDQAVGDLGKPRSS
jgi:predicted DNA-binding mobile mystery protein A